MSCSSVGDGVSEEQHAHNARSADDQTHQRQQPAAKPAGERGSDLCITQAHTEGGAGLQLVYQHPRFVCKLHTKLFLPSSTQHRSHMRERHAARDSDSSSSSLVASRPGSTKAISTPAVDGMGSWCELLLVATCGHHCLPLC